MSTEKQSIENRQSQNVNQGLPAEEKQRLSALLAAYPEIAGKLLEALGSGRFFITVSCQKKDSAADPSDLKHYWSRTGFEIDHVLPSIKQVTASWAAVEKPEAAVEGGGWH